jgi:uncharacterized iron-regulated membrane protein
MSTARTWLWWHTWIGITTGILLFVICWSGTVAVLSHEIDWLLDPALRVTPPADAAAQPRWQATVDAARRAVPGMHATQLVLPPQPTDAAMVLMEGEQGALQRVYVDPYAARVQGVRSYFNVQRFFRSLHMNLFFNLGPWGYLLVGAFAVPLLASLVTALLFYRRWWQRFLVLKLHRGAPIFWSDLHKTGGLWSLWFALLMSLTGAWYFIEAAGIEPAYPETPEFHATTANSGARTPLSVDTLLARARTAWAALEPRSVTLPGSWLGETFAVDGQSGEVLVRDRANRLFLDPARGTEQARLRAADLSPAARWVDTADPLHFGNFAGLAVKWIWFVFGLLLSAMSLTGAYLHIRRLRRKQPGARRRPAVVVANAVSFAVIVACCVGGWLEIRGYGSTIDGVRTMPEVPLAVQAFIGGWVALTAAILAVWAHKLR